MINFLSRIIRLHTKIALSRQSSMKARDSVRKSILPLRILGKANKSLISHGETESTAQRHISRRPPKLGVPSNQPAARDAAENSDVAAFRSDLELMLASMSAALARNQWRSDGVDTQVSDPDSTLESDVADAVRQLSLRALGV